MKQNLFWSALAVCALSLLAPRAHAAIYNVTLTEDKPTLVISQYYTVQIVKTEPMRDDLFVEVTEDKPGQWTVRTLPSDVEVHYQLIDTTPTALRGRLVAVHNTSQHPLQIAEATDTKTTYASSDTVLTFTSVAAVPTDIVRSIALTQLEAASIDEGMSVIIAKKAVKKQFEIEVKALDSMPLPQNMQLVSPIYQYDVQNTSALDTSFPLTVKIQYTNDNSLSKKIYFFDKGKGTWVPMPSYNDVEEGVVRATTHLTYAPVAVFATTRATDGKASWYAYKGCLCAASRDYPKGTKLKVTRLKTGKSITVTVNDYGPEAWTKRIIDLDKVAFKALGTLGTGVMYVSVESL